MYSGKFVDHLQSRVELIPMESVMERVKQKLTFVDERISTKDFRINKEKDAQRLSRQMSK